MVSFTNIFYCKYKFDRLLVCHFLVTISCCSWGAELAVREFSGLFRIYEWRTFFLITHSHTVNTWKKSQCHYRFIIKNLLISYFAPQNLIEHSTHAHSYSSLYVNVWEEAECWNVLGRPLESLGRVSGLVRVWISRGEISSLCNFSRAVGEGERICTKRSVVALGQAIFQWYNVKCLWSKDNVWETIY